MRLAATGGAPAVGGDELGDLELPDQPQERRPLDLERRGGPAAVAGKARERLEDQLALELADGLVQRNRVGLHVGAAVTQAPYHSATRQAQHVVVPLRVRGGTACAVSGLSAGCGIYTVPTMRIDFHCPIMLVGGKRIAQGSLTSGQPDRSRDEKPSCPDNDRSDGSRDTLTGRYETLEGDGCRHHRHRAQVHDPDNQEDRRQTGTAIGAAETEAQAVSPGRAGVGRQRTITPGYLPAAGKVTRLPSGELKRAGDQDVRRPKRRADPAAG